MSDLRTKELIQRTALPLFVECGVAETSTRDVAQSAGVSPGAVCDHYASKKDESAGACSRLLHDQLPLSPSPPSACARSAADPINIRCPQSSKPRLR